ncbi:unknown [[Clostridium] clostridioforme CAG:511]|nr:unknown [[Clostridium] clostridioforme CAG:511]
MKDRLLLHGIQCIVNTHKLCTAFLTAIMFIKYTILNPILQDPHLERLQAAKYNPILQAIHHTCGRSLFQV